MKRIHQLAIEKGVRGKLILAAGGTQVVPVLAIQSGMDAGFGRGSHGIDVATFLIKRRRELRAQKK
jgi:D-ornithine 4,5-aminomutase subunit beta